MITKVNLDSFSLEDCIDELIEIERDNDCLSSEGKLLLRTIIN